MNNFSKLMVEGAVVLGFGLGAPNAAVSQVQISQSQLDSISSAVNEKGKTTVLETSSGNQVAVMEMNKRVVISFVENDISISLAYDKHDRLFVVSASAVADPLTLFVVAGKGGVVSGFNGFVSKYAAEKTYNLAMVRGIILLEQVMGDIANYTGKISRAQVGGKKIIKIYNIFLPEAQKCIPFVQKMMEQQIQENEKEQLIYNAPKKHFDGEPLRGGRNYVEAAGKVSNRLAVRRQPMQQASGPVRIRDRL